MADSKQTLSEVLQICEVCAQEGIFAGAFLKIFFINSLPNHPSTKAIRTTQVGIGISILLVAIKYLSGHFGHSYALIADETKTCAHLLSSPLLWIGLKVAAKPADRDHPYGHGKAEPLAAL